ncbi:MAG: hypothetical protein CMJ05_07770 [Pelagibacterales bacterium]|nr:hypothetical protein [Pelagibacterales bacterium]
MEVGSFFEVYTKVDPKTKEITEQQVIDLRNITSLSPGKKSDSIRMFGFTSKTPSILKKHMDNIIKNGYTVVIYEQDARSKNTTRSLKGIFSPGTYFDEESNNVSNNISCIWIESHKSSKINKIDNMVIGFSTIDIYTGKSNMYEIETENLHNPTTYDELERFINTYNPNETIIISNIDENKIDDIITYVNLNNSKITKINTSDKRIINAEKQSYQREIINQFFSANVSESFINNSNHFVYGVQSYVYLINYIYEHNPNLINKIQEPIIENNTDRMLLANHSLQQLNIIDDNKYKGKLSSVSKLLNNCITPMGIRKFKYNILHPTVNQCKMERSYNITEYLLINDILWKSWRNDLKNIKDIEKLNRQIYLKNITPSNLFSFYESLSTIKEIFDNLTTNKEIYNYVNSEINMNITTVCNMFRERIDKTFVIEECRTMDNISLLDDDKNIIKIGTNKELDDIVRLYNNSNRKLETVLEHLSSIISQGEKHSKNSYVKKHSTDKDGILLQCTSRRGKILKEQIQKGKSQIKLQYIDTYDNKEEFDFTSDIHTSTGTGGNVNITNEFITKLCNTITSSKQKMMDLIRFVYNNFIISLQEFDNEFLNINNFCSTIDILQNSCYIATKYNYHKPNVKQGEKSYVKAGNIRHPLIEQLNTEELYVTNNINVGVDKDLILLYGTNAVGKTSIIKALGINIIMAQAGLYVACDNFEFVPYTCIFTRILGNDNLFKGQSTFAVEMSELRVILKMANKNSLILGDELCSGTEHDSAVSIFMSGIQTLHNKESSSIFATHLHEILDFDEIVEMKKLDVKHLTVTYNEAKDMLIYDRKLKDGPGESMYGLEVCKSLHLPKDFLENAYNIRKKYNKLDEGILSKKTSHFNSKKIMGKCEMCNNKVGTEVHHLQHQENADKNNMINSFHKNHPANLLTVCDGCHNNIHKTGKQHKKVKTNKGTKIMEIRE